MKKDFSKFTRIYSLQKTLRFGLEAIHGTEEHIEKKGLLKEDEKRAQDYKKAKKIIDEYHKDFIAKRLADFSFQEEDLNTFAKNFECLKKSGGDKELGKLKEQQTRFRGEVAKRLLEDKKLFEKEFIKKDLPEWLDTNSISIDGIDDPKAIIGGFKKWTTYFAGFNENRKNIYTKKAHSTSIGYRLIHDNLPKFLDNIERYKKAKELGVDFSEVENHFSVRLDEVFKIGYFNKCLTQKGIDRYNLIRGKEVTEDNENRRGINEIINLHAQQLERELGSASDESKDQLKSKIRNVRSCKIEKLFKQILSDRDILSFRLEDIDSDANLCEKINFLFYVNEREKLISQYEDSEKGIQALDITENLKNILYKIEDADPEKIYVRNDKEIRNISKFLFKDEQTIKNSLENYVGEKFPNSKKKRESWLEKSLYFSFSDIHGALKSYFGEDNRELANSKALFDYFKNLTIRKEDEDKDIFEEIKRTYQEAKKVIQEYQDISDEKLKNNKEKVQSIKSYLEALMDLYHFLKPLYVQFKGDREKKSMEYFSKDIGFYAEFDPLFEVVRKIVPLYNQTRNYLTKKPYRVEKFKLNFEHQTLLRGFVDSYTKSGKATATQYGAYIFRKKHLQFNEYEYFLGVSKNTQLFRCHLKEKVQNDDKSEYERLEYYQPKVTTFFSKKYTEENKGKIVQFLSEKVKERCEGLKKETGDIQKYDEITKQLLKTNTGEYISPKKLIEEMHKKEEIFDDILNTEELQVICQDTIGDLQNHAELYIDNNPQLSCVIEERYSGYQGFLDIVDDLQKIAKESRKFGYFPVSQKELESSMNNEEKPLYIFRISNKDLDFYHKASQGSRRKKGLDNLHTLYLKHLLSGEQKVIDLGSGELFYRKRSISQEERIIHPKNRPILCKTYREKNDNTEREEVKTVPHDVYQELTKFYKGELLENNLGQKSKELKSKVETKTFDYDIIKDRRYTKDSFHLHLSIKLNFPQPSESKKFNSCVNTFLKGNQNINIIGIDRGERHLAYYTVVDQKGSILKNKKGEYLQGSFNNPLDSRDYHELLDKREKERDRARKSWETIEKIKDLKEGYLSQVVHKIAKLMLEHNAIVVFENLNKEFKQMRIKVEKQVYQKLEKMLTDKLSYLVLKDQEPSKAGGVLNAFQLAVPIQSFKDLDTQTGFIFYVPAYHTSKVCPATGFVNLLYPHYRTIGKSKEFLKKFDKICYNKKEKQFEFHVNYENFTEKAKGHKQEWVICSYGERLQNFRNEQKKWDSRKVELSKEMENLFKKYSIDFSDGGCLIAKIVGKNDKDFFKPLIDLLKLTLQMRNSKIGTDEDWIISPVKDKNGSFFDSRGIKDKSGSFNKNASMPENADANGAYHIALKGLLMLQQLNKLGGQVKSFKPNITNKLWYEFLKKRYE